MNLSLLNQKVLLSLIVLLIVAPVFAANTIDKPVIHNPAFPLLDENGDNVLKSGLPYSSQKSCGGSSCHDYTKISHGFHFEQGRAETDDDYGKKRGDTIPGFGRLGMSSLVGPGFFGGYNCVQGSQTGVLAKKFNLDSTNFGDWGAAGFLKACSSCHLGGGWEEKDRYGNRYDLMPDDKVVANDGDYFERDSTSPTGLKRWDWKKSGVREIDCLGCHVDFSSLTKFPSSNLGKNGGTDKTSDAYTHWGVLQDTQFIQKGFFRYANSAILEFLNLRPDLPEGLQLLTVERTIQANTTAPSYSLNLNELGLPKLNWNKQAFDSNGNVSMPMLYFPNNDNCMMCHLASAGINRVSSGKANGSRRGFYGFGDDAQEKQNTDGTRVNDFKDDVHKGKVWVADNGETREIQNCNACHAKDYYKNIKDPVPLSPDHQFLKGDGDSDVRHDLSNMDEPLACSYCHDTAKNPSLPTTGKLSASAAHLDLWKQRGFMEGYAPTALSKVVNVHLKTIACQSCHINKIGYNNVAGGTINYRNKIDFDGVMRTVPYKPYNRYYAQDVVSGRILSRYETQSVLSKKTDSAGKAYGAIIDPTDGKTEIGRVSINAQGQLGDPVDYAGYKLLQNAYNSLLVKKGYVKPDVRFIYTETSAYYLNHQTRPAVEAVQCVECHDKNKVTGAYESARSANGLFGTNKFVTLATLPDRKLVDDGVFILAKPYMHVDDKGNIVINAAEALEFSKNNPSLSVLSAQTSREVNGGFKVATALQTAKFTGINKVDASKLSTTLKNTQWLVFSNRVADKSLRQFAMILPNQVKTASDLADTQVQVQSRSVSDVDIAQTKKLGVKKFATDIYSVAVKDGQRVVQKALINGDVVIKLPYNGTQVKSSKVGIAYTANGKTWAKLPAASSLHFAQASTTGGYVVFKVNKSQYPNFSGAFALVE